MSPLSPYLKNSANSTTYSQIKNNKITQKQVDNGCQIEKMNCAKNSPWHKPLLPENLLYPTISPARGNLPCLTTSPDRHPLLGISQSAGCRPTVKATARKIPMPDNLPLTTTPTPKTFSREKLPSSTTFPISRGGQLSGRAKFPCASTSYVPLLQGASTSRVRTPPLTSSPRYQPTRARLSPHGEGSPWPKISPTNNLLKRSDNNPLESYTPP